ncbi:Protein of unknown function [Amycolatopsis xylanica]|uniref:DUF1453 domain-containing protein n=1 Tax=Amycolatopsis xylanica TaxID=589385 RepID=A0A1H3RNF5_9PSEU|nr:DUF1453 family protein [Amycolatopsis xylanica]SDZ27284.1 Protein of unknown function [Amycolatopsis xylanica]
MSGVTQIVLIVAVIGYVLVRRMAGQPAEAKRMLVLPAILVVIGLSDIGSVTRSGIALTFLVVTTALGVALGALRGLSIRLYHQDGLVFMRYTWVTVLLWVANIGVKVGSGALLAALDKGTDSNNAMFVSLGLGLLAEGVVVLAKALRSDHQIVWKTGKDGAPHERSPFLDDLQRRASRRG